MSTVELRILFNQPVWDERDQMCVVGEIDGLLVCLTDSVTMRVIILRTVLGPFGWPPVGQWFYDDVDLAVREAIGWLRGSAVEPEGWVRHAPSGRFRPDGDPSGERVLTKVGVWPTV